MTGRRLLAGSVGALLPAVIGAWNLAADEWAFDFGAPASVTREGFVKVTKAGIFAPGRAHGFESDAGLLEVDRTGSYWWKKQMPTDTYLARTYGEYRATSYSTCDFVEGTQDNAFLLKAPDGEYEVWAVVTDPAEAPPFFGMHANGKLKQSVRLGRRGFVFMEPFRARAEGGVLRIELKGSHGWLLNALVVGTPGAALTRIVSDMERDIFFDYPEHLADWKRIEQEPGNPPPDFTAEEQARGYVVCARDYTVKVYPFTNPERREIDRALTTFATAGEFEPASAAVYPAKDLGVVDVEVSDFTSADGNAIPSDRVKIGIVRCWKQRSGSGSGPSGHYAIEPEVIEPATSRLREVNAGETRQWWFTLHVPEDARPGRYRAQVAFRPEAAPPVELEWRLLVLPFQLTRPTDRHWGTWLDSFPPLAGLRGPERRGRNTSAEADRLAGLEMEDFRDHGFDVAILECSGIGVTENADGSFSYDIGILRRQMEYLKILGEQAVVPICFEYLCRRLEYQYADEPEGEHVAGNFSPKARAAIAGLVQHLEAERKRNDWPRFLYLPIDEPGNNKTANRMTFGRNVLEMVQSVPGAQTGCTITARGVQQLGERVNTRIYAYGHVSREVARRDAERGFPYWYYNNGIMYGASTTASRNYTGFEFLRSGAECATGWGFAAYHYNPYNDFDGRHRDWCVLLPGADGPIPTIYWELCREGVDDCRYVATLQERIAGSGDESAANRARAVLAPLLDPQATPISNPGSFHRYRWQLAREILNLAGRGDPAPAIGFTPVVSASPMEESLEANVIENPSFENEPQADGLPGWPYPYDDPYSEERGKPSGAISVADEVAHDGKQSLKWDFAKSEGKGSQYGRSQYLIINVQVADDVVPRLIGRRVQVGMWVRTGGGTLIPGMNLRMFGKREGEYGFLDSIPYQGGLEDAAVWNRFEAEGAILPETERIDIHIFCKIPDDPEVRDEAVFYIDDVSLRPITPVPLKIETPLDELYVGEPMSWQVSAAEPAQNLMVSLLRGADVLEQTVVREAGDRREGSFATEGLSPGVYRLRATAETQDGGEPLAAWREVIVAPDPFAW
jgi:hypothetical protein